MTWAPWTRETALAALQRFFDLRGYQPISKEASAAHGLPTWAATKRLFGGWNAYVEAGGFRPYPARSSTQAKTMVHRDRNPK